MQPSDTRSDTALIPSQQTASELAQPTTLLPTVLASYSALPDSESAGVVTTLDLRERVNQVVLQNILAGESTSCWDVREGVCIRVTDITCHFAEVPDEETGEVVGKRIITLTGPDGTFHTCSQYAYRDLQRAVLLTNWRPGNEPLKLRPAKARTRKGNTRQTLMMEE